MANASTLSLEQFAVIGTAQTLNQTDAHDKKNSCLSCVHKLLWNT